MQEKKKYVASTIGWTRVLALTWLCGCSGASDASVIEVARESGGTGTAAGVSGGTAGFGAAGQPSVAGSSAGASGAIGTLVGSAGGPSFAAGSGGVSGGSGEAGAAGLSAGAAAAGAAGSAMAGNSGAADGGSGGAAGTGIDDACSGGTMEMDSSSLRAGSEYGAVKYQAALSNTVTELKTTLMVPKVPTMQGVLFIWPGLQSLGGKDPAKLGNGILQPVLTWGSSCAPSLPKDLSTWWVSGMYVNVSTSAAGPTGCAGGDSMNVAAGDALSMDIRLSGTTWKQAVTDMQSSKSVDFSIDLKGQSQNWVTFAIELPMGGGNVIPSAPVVYANTVLTFESPVDTCAPDARGPNDSFTAPILSKDKLHCCYEKISLRSRGTPAM